MLHRNLSENGYSRYTNLLHFQSLRSGVDVVYDGRIMFTDIIICLSLLVIPDVSLVTCIRLNFMHSISTT
jgi:hypothetical protein